MYPKRILYGRPSTFMGIASMYNIYASFATQTNPKGINVTAF